MITKYSTLHFSPDIDEDIAFNGIAQNALRQDLANGASSGRDLSPRRRPYLARRRDPQRGANQRRHDELCLADRRRRHPDLEHAAVHDQRFGENRLDLQRLRARRMEGLADRDRQLRRPVRRREHLHDGKSDQPAPQRGVAGDAHDDRSCAAMPATSRRRPSSCSPRRTSPAFAGTSADCAQIGPGTSETGTCPIRRSRPSATNISTPASPRTSCPASRSALTSITNMRGT